MSVIEVFADISCPFTYVGLRSLVDRRAAVGSANRIVVHAWPLEWVNGRGVTAEAVAPEISALRASVAPELFAGFNPETFPVTTLPALALCARAYRTGVDTGEAVALATRIALFEQGLDVSDPEVLHDLALAHDLDPTETDSDRADVAREYEDGKTRGVVGSPYFIVDGGGFFCPSLEISKQDGEFSVVLDTKAFEDFVSRAFRVEP
ncbi:MAG: DsbA family protein [Acidimicrobiia bacterium]|nr:DsbA family protein [Acidimicrobiia bacterium]